MRISLILICVTAIIVESAIFQALAKRKKLPINVCIVLAMVVAEIILGIATPLVGSGASMIQGAPPEVGTYQLLKAKYENGAYHIWYGDESEEIFANDNEGGEIYVFAYTIKIRPTNGRASKVEFTEDGSCVLYVSVLTNTPVNN